MDKDKLGPVCSVIGTFSFILFGVVGFMNLRTPLNITNIFYGILVGILFGFISKFFFSMLLAIFNGDVRKNHDKGAIKTAVKRSTVFMFPYALLCFLAAYFLGWAASAIFFSAGIMNTGVMANAEISKLKEKPAMKNNIVTSVIASAISYLWMFSAVYLNSALGYADFLVNLGLSFLGVKK